MKLLILIFVGLLSSIGFAMKAEVGESSPKEITIGFLPQGDLAIGKKGALALAQALQDELNLTVNIFVSKNYVGLVEAMKSKKIDFAFLPSLAYVFAEKNAGAKVLLKTVWEEPFYYSLLVTKKSSAIQSPKDLAGKRIAFVDEKSASGYLYPQVMFKKMKFDTKKFKKIIFSGSHKSSVALFDNNEVDAIAIFADDKKGKISALTKYTSQGSIKDSIKGSTMDQLKILWVSEPIPNDPFCVRQDFYDQYPKLTHSLMFSLIDIVDKLKRESEISEFVGGKGFVPATSRQYDPVREMVRELDLKLQ